MGSIFIAVELISEDYLSIYQEFGTFENIFFILVKYGCETVRINTRGGLVLC